MTDTPPVTEPTIEPNPTTILQRIALPLFSFSGVLFLSLLASQTFLLPRLTTFRVGDLTVSVDEAIAYERTLRADVLSLDDARTALVLPYIDDTHAALMERKRAQPSVIDVKQRIETTMRRVAEGAGAAAFVDAVLVDGVQGTVTVRGRVEDPKPSSMAVLGAAVDAVRLLPEVLDLTPPALTREALRDGGYRSPFRFTFTLRP